jgi:hypothetical protein
LNDSEQNPQSKNASLISQVRRLARTLHIAKRTEEANVGWITRFAAFSLDFGQIMSQRR